MMKERYIDVDGAWGILLCYDYTRGDFDRMRSIMDSFGMSEYRIIEAMQVLRKKNTGMVVSRSDLTMSAMFISPASDHEQLMDTIAHEIDHIQHAIIRHYDVECGSEDAAWLQGYIMREITRIIDE
jgi:hypothetical protein